MGKPKARVGFRHEVVRSSDVAEPVLQHGATGQKCSSSNDSSAGQVSAGLRVGSRDHVGELHGELGAGDGGHDIPFVGVFVICHVFPAN